MPATFRLDPKDRNYTEVRRRFIATLGAELQEGPRTVLIQEPKRTDEQNSLMWVLLHTVAEQVGWRKARWRGDTMLEEGRYVSLAEEPGAKRLTPEQFKDVLTAALRQPQMLGGIDGGVVAVGLSTSRMTKRQVSELIELIYAFGADHGVEWNEPRTTQPET
jgi:hypothetical protein